MRLLKIAKLGHPVLRRRAQEVSDAKEKFWQDLAQDMIVTMQDARGIGLAAPQIYQPWRIIIIDLSMANDDHFLCDAQGVPYPPQPLCLINPILHFTSPPDRPGIEGCLSIPGWRGMVKRAEKLNWQAVNLQGEPCSGSAAGLPARILQHECDHLDGIVFLDRMEDMQSLACEEELHHLRQHTESSHEENPPT